MFRLKTACGIGWPRRPARCPMNRAARWKNRCPCPAPLTEPLVDVRVEGNATIPASAIAKYIKTRSGRAADRNQIREDVRSLYGTRWFLSVEPRYRQTDAGLVLIFKVIERPIVQKVEYQGNNSIKTKHLEAITGLKRGSRVRCVGQPRSGPGHRKPLPRKRFCLCHGGVGQRRIPPGSRSGVRHQGRP